MSNNSWESYQNSYRNAVNYIETLNITSNINAFYDMIHQIVWHYGKDPIRWINANKDLVAKISKFRSFIDYDDAIKEEVRNSIIKLER